MTQPAPPAQPGVMTAEQIAAEKKALGPEAITDRDTRQYFDLPNGDGTFRQVNAFGEEKGSPEDRKRGDKASSAP